MHKHIKDIPLFQGLPPEQLETLNDMCVEGDYGKGQHILAEGDPGDGIFIVASGQVRVFKLSPYGKEQTLHMFSAGDTIGEAAVFAGEPFPAHAKASEQSHLLFLLAWPTSCLIHLCPLLPFLVHLY